MRIQHILVAAAVAGTALLSAGTVVSFAGQDLATVSAPKTIEVVARKYAFEPDRIEVREGERVRLIVRSADSVHGLQIKRFGVNKLVPRGGDPVTIDFTANHAGTFEILCSEYCGNHHDAMKGTLVVIASPQPPSPLRQRER